MTVNKMFPFTDKNYIFGWGGGGGGGGGIGGFGFGVD